MYAMPFTHLVELIYFLKTFFLNLPGIPNVDNSTLTTFQDAFSGPLFFKPVHAWLSHDAAVDNCLSCCFDGSFSSTTKGKKEHKVRA